MINSFFNKHKWISSLIIAFAIILFTILAYVLFNGKYSSSTINLYQPGSEAGIINEQANLAREFINKYDHFIVYFVGWALIIGLVISALILYGLKKINGKILTIYVLVLGIIVRIIYSNLTDNIFTRQYDVWSTSYFGHYGLTMQMYNEWELFAIEGNLNDYYQLYNPKFAYFIYAVVMKINSIFIKGSSSFSLYESIRIFTCLISIATLFVSYFIFKELFKKTSSILFGTLFIGGSPLLIRLSASSGNDVLLCFFLALSIYFLIKFYKSKQLKEKILYLFGLTLSEGFAIQSNFYGYFLLIPILIVLIYKLIKDIKESQKENRSSTVKSYVYMYLSFGILMSGLSLIWPLINSYLYNQEFGYFWHFLNNGLKIPETYTFSQRYLYFSFKTYFNDMFVQLWSSSSYNGIVDYNLYSSLMKTMIFGEFSYNGNSLIFSSILYGVSLVLFIVLIMYICYIVIKNILDKNYSKSLSIVIATLLVLTTMFIVGYSSSLNIDLLVFGIVTLVMLGLLIYVSIKKRVIFTNDKKSILFILIFVSFFIAYFARSIVAPYTCSYDARHFVILPLIGAFVISSIFEDENNKAIKGILASVLSLYIFSSIGLYLTV